MITRLRDRWAESTLRDLFEDGSTGAFPMPSKLLATALEESHEVGDSYYELAELDRAVARALAEQGPSETSPNPKVEALLGDGFESRVSDYLAAETQSSAAAWVAFAAIVAAMLIVVLGPLQSADEVPESDYTVRGPEAPARSIANLLCIKDSEVLVQPDGRRASCSIDAIFQPTFRDEGARGLYLAVFAIGPDGTTIPIVPNPADTAAFQMEANGAEQTIGPPRELAANYQPGVSHVFFVGSDKELGWEAFEPLLQSLDGTVAVDLGSIRDEATARLGTRPELVMEIPFVIQAAQ